MHSEMFQDIERRARRALNCVYTESISNPLLPDDADYLAFFTRIVERFEGGVESVRTLVEEEGRDLLARASMHVFIHLLRSDPDFDFEAVIGPVPRVIREAWGSGVEDHVDALLAQFAPDGHEEQHEADGYGIDDSGDDYMSP